MVLGLSLQAFTILHVIISLVAIASGIVVAFGMAASRRMPGWTALFLVTTILTSVTGFLFPINGFTPGIGLGIYSLVLLAVALVALYGKGTMGAWRWIYIVTALAALQANILVLIIQSFQKISFLHAFAPTQSNEPAFVGAQGVALVVVVILGFLAIRKYPPGIVLGS
jgi:hypothetical protein